MLLAADDARSIAFDNPFKYVNDRAVKVQALVKVGGTWQPVHDWTGYRGQAFCRDMRAEWIEELLIVLTNSNWQDPNHVLHAYQPMQLVATNVGCWRWSGTAKLVETLWHSYTLTTEADVIFELSRASGVPEKGLNIEDYDVLSGTAVARITTTPGTICEYVGRPVTVSLKWNDGNLTVHNLPTDDGTDRLYIGPGGEFRRHLRCHLSRGNDYEGVVECDVVRHQLDGTGVREQ